MYFGQIDDSLAVLEKENSNKLNLSFYNINKIEGPVIKTFNFPKISNNCKIKIDKNSTWIFLENEMTSFDNSFLNEPQFKTKNFEF